MSVSYCSLARRRLVRNGTDHGVEFGSVVVARSFALSCTYGECASAPSWDAS